MPRCPRGGRRGRGLFRAPRGATSTCPAVERPPPPPPPPSPRPGSPATAKSSDASASRGRSPGPLVSRMEGGGLVGCSHRGGVGDNGVWGLSSLFLGCTPVVHE